MALIRVSTSELKAKAEELKNSKAHLEELFYEWLFEPLGEEEKQALARTLSLLGERCREEWRAGFPHVRERLEEEQLPAQPGGEP